MRELSTAPDGFFPLAKLITFNRVAALTKDVAVLREAVQQLPQLLTCSADGNAVKRAVRRARSLVCRGALRVGRRAQAVVGSLLARARLRLRACCACAWRRAFFHQTPLPSKVSAAKQMARTVFIDHIEETATLDSVKQRLEAAVGPVRYVTLPKR